MTGAEFFLEVEQENKGNLCFVWGCLRFGGSFLTCGISENIVGTQIYQATTSNSTATLKHQSPQGCEPALGAYQFARDFLCNVAEMTGGQAIALSSAAMLADVTWQPRAMGHGFTRGGRVFHGIRV